MRLIVVDPYYPAFLEAHYEAAPELRERPYAEQLRSLLSRRFATSDVYSHHLEKLGHAAAEIVPNCEPLAVRWAQEHGSPWSRLLRPTRFLPGAIAASMRLRLFRRIALAQIEAFEADVVYVQDPSFFAERELRSLRRRGRFVVGQIASALPSQARLRAFDLLVTALPTYVEHFRALGVETVHLPLAFDERVVDEVATSWGDEGRPYNLGFVGGLDPAIYGAGTAVLERVAATFDLAVWGFNPQALRPESPVRRCYRGEAWGLEMYRVLGQTRVALNRHGEIARGYAANMRLFEATGMGALLVTEAATNLAELFEPGGEVVAYDGVDDLIEKLRHYLEHDEERERIAVAGRDRTLREHTYGRRIAELTRVLEERL